MAGNSASPTTRLLRPKAPVFNKASLLGPTLGSIREPLAHSFVISLALKFTVLINSTIVHTQRGNAIE